MREGGPLQVPISATPGAPNGSGNYNGVPCNLYTSQLAASNDTAQSVNIITPNQVWASPNPVPVPSSGLITVTFYVSQNLSGSVTAQASEAGYANRDIAVRMG
jgi:hypothetical protein